MTSEREAVIAAVRKFLMTDHAAAIREIAADENLFEGGVLDSLRVVSLVVFLEESFNCRLDFDELTEENLRTLHAIGDLILRKAGGSRS